MGSPRGWVGGASSLPSSAASYGAGHSCSPKGHMLLRHAVPPRHTHPRTTHLENTGIRELTVQLPSQGRLGQEYLVFTRSDIADVQRKC